jgi:hypothetical protein
MTPPPTCKEPKPIRPSRLLKNPFRKLNGGTSQAYECDRGGSLVHHKGLNCHDGRGSAAQKVVRMGVGKLIYVRKHTQGIVDPVVFHNPLSLEGITHLQVLHYKLGMVTLMLAPSAGVEYASLSQA